MSKMGNQLNEILKQAYSEGLDKHSMKHSGTDETLRHVFTDDEYSQLKSTGNMLINYCRDNFEGVTKFYKINSDMVQSFMEDKAKTVAQSTLNTYTANIHKLEVLISDKYPNSCGDLKWWEETTTPISARSEAGKIRDVWATEDQTNVILKYLDDNKDVIRSQVPLVFEVVCVTGMRVHEVLKMKPEDIKFHEDGRILEIHIIGKGGRPRDITIESERLYEKLQDAIESKGLGQKDTFVNLTERGATKWMGETMDKLNIKYDGMFKEIQSAGVCFHAWRKMVATNMAIELREEGLNKREICDRVADFLGHGDGRYDTWVTYIQGSVLASL